MDYTVAEVEAAISQADIDWYDLEYESVTLTLNGEEVETKAIKSFGGEGQGDDCWLVFQVGNQLFRKDGWYASHYGYEWDGSLYEVEAVERTVTVYEEKK